MTRQQMRKICDAAEIRQGIAHRKICVAREMAALIGAWDLYEIATSDLCRHALSGRY